MNWSNLNRRGAIAATLLGLNFNSFGQSRPLSIIVPQPAGNPTDGIARKLQPVLQRILDQTVIVENYPGAGGSIGIQKSLQSYADAPVIIITSQTEPILTPLALKAVRYKAQDLRPIALVGRVAYALAGRPDLPASNLAQLKILAKTARLSLGHIGEGSMIHLLAVQWARMSGVNLEYIPYRGVPPVVQDVMGSQIDLTFLPMGGNTPSLIQSGKVRAYGLTGRGSSSQFPTLLPLSVQDPNLSDFVYDTWASLLVPRSTPQGTVEKLHTAVYKGFEDAEFRAYLAAAGVEPDPLLSLSQLDKFYLDEIRTHEKLAKTAGLVPVESR